MRGTDLTPYCHEAFFAVGSYLYGCEKMASCFKGSSEIMSDRERKCQNNNWTLKGVTGKWTVLHTDVTRVFKVVKLRKARWVGHVARKEAKLKSYNICVGKISGKVPTRMNEKKKGFPVGSDGQENSAVTIFEINRQFLLYLTVLIQE
jgi:hypothetical protein